MRKFLIQMSELWPEPFQIIPGSFPDPFSNFFFFLKKKNMIVKVVVSYVLCIITQDVEIAWQPWKLCIITWKLGIKIQIKQQLRFVITMTKIVRNSIISDAASNPWFHGYGVSSVFLKALADY